MKNYKGTDVNMCCNNFKFKLGVRYSIPDHQPLYVCNIGFHSCDTLWEVAYYYYPVHDSRYFEVEVEETISKENKNCSRHITLLRELTFYEVMRLLNRKQNGGALTENDPQTNIGFFNIGNNNNGNSNVGNNNNGNVNNGSWNDGNYNIGDNNNGNNNCT